MKAESVLVCHFLARGHLVGLTEEFYCAYDFALVFGGIPFHLIPLGIWKLKDDNCVTINPLLFAPTSTRNHHDVRGVVMLWRNKVLTILVPTVDLAHASQSLITRFWQMNKI